MALSGWGFYRASWQRALHDAWHHSHSAYWALVLLAGGASVLFGFYLEKHLMIWIPFGVFVALVIVGLCRSAYRLYLEAEQGREAVEAELAKTKEECAATIAKLTEEASAGLAAVREEAARVHERDVEQQRAALKKQHEVELEAIRAQLGDRVQRAAVRLRLGEFLEEGQRLQAACANVKEPEPLAEAEQWADRVEAFLTKELGAEYVTRFHSDQSIPAVYSPPIHSLPHRKLWLGLRVRLINLERFLSEMTERG